MHRFLKLILEKVKASRYFYSNVSSKAFEVDYFYLDIYVYILVRIVVFRAVVSNSYMI